MEETLRAYRRALLENERAELTVEKYLHEAAALLDWLNGAEPSKEKLLEYRGELQGQFTARTVNNKLSAVNTFLQFLGREDCRVKLLKVQRTAFADESRELTETEYRRLLEVAQEKGDQRTYYILLTLADVLGHSSIEMTRIYIAVTASAHERIMRRMHLIE